MFRSSHHRSIAAVAALVAAACVRVAANADGADLPTEPVGEYTSEPGETEVPFLARVGGQLHAFSARTQFEACGMVATTPDHARFGVLAHTNRSHVGCLSDSRSVPAGMASTDVTIHSHPTERGVMLNRADRAVLAMAGAGDVQRGLQRSASAPSTVSIETDGFSATDYTRPGYLAAASGLLYQDGPGTARLVATYPEASK